MSNQSFRYAVVNTIGSGTCHMLPSYDRAIRMASEAAHVLVDGESAMYGEPGISLDELMLVSTGPYIMEARRKAGFVFDCLTYPGGPRVLVLEIPI